MKEKEANREERNYAALENGPLVMAEFYAAWCPHCQRMMPVVEDFKRKTKGELEVVQIDIEEESELAERFNVDTIPTFILLREGETLWRQSGELSVERLEKAVKEEV